MVNFRTLLAVATTILTQTVLAQGSAGGYGQNQGGGFGQGGGGFGGLEGGRSGAPADKAKGFADADRNLVHWESKDAILSPGDRVEFKLKFEADETLVCSVTSDAFDPAISVEDGKGKVLAKNDDRQEGNQSPLVIHRFGTAGEFVVKVISYGKTSGGKFTLRWRKFAALTGSLGKSRLPVPTSEDESDLRLTPVRLRLNANDVLQVRDVNGRVGRSTQRLPLQGLIGPSGVDATDFEFIPTPVGGELLVAKKEGDYYFEFASNNPSEILTDFELASVHRAAPDATLNLSLKAREVAIIETEVTPGLLVSTVLNGDAQMAVSAPADEDWMIRGQTTPDAELSNQFAEFRFNRATNKGAIRVFRGKGTARFVVSGIMNREAQVKFTNTTTIDQWEPGKPLSANLELSDYKYYLLSSQVSELMHVGVSTTQFQPRLDIIRLNGVLANSLVKFASTSVSDDLYFPDRGTFLIRISCEGHGGRGQFTLQRDVLKAAPLVLNTAADLVLDGSNFGLFESELQAGVRYELIVDGATTPLRVDLLSQEGDFLTSQRVRFENVEVQYFTVQTAGKYRLWLRGAPGTSKFRFRPHPTPGIGG